MPPSMAASAILDKKVEPEVGAFAFNGVSDPACANVARDGRLFDSGL